MTAAAVVLAGGSGSRARLGQNKTLVEIGGRSLVEWSVAAFTPHVDRIVVVARPADRAEMASLLGDRVAAVVDGGATRPDSERAGLAALDGVDLVAVHDAARPLVPAAVIQRVLAAADEGVAVVPALARDVPVARWDAEDDGPVLHDAMLVDRSGLVGVQTPQAAPLEVLRAAFAAADGAGDRDATDTVEPVLRYLDDVPVVAVEGDHRSLKVTWGSDVDRIRRLAEDPAAAGPQAGLRLRPGRPTGGPPMAQLEVDGVTPVTDSLRLVRDGRIAGTVDRRGLVDVTGDLLAVPGTLEVDDDLASAVERAVLDGATLRLRRRR